MSQKVELIIRSKTTGMFIESCRIVRDSWTVGQIPEATWTDDINKALAIADIDGVYTLAGIRKLIEKVGGEAVTVQIETTRTVTIINDGHAVA